MELVRVEVLSLVLIVYEEKIESIKSMQTRMMSD